MTEQTDIDAAIEHARSTATGYTLAVMLRDDMRLDPPFGRDADIADVVSWLRSHERWDTFRINDIVDAPERIGGDGGWVIDDDRASYVVVVESDADDAPYVRLDVLTGEVTVD